MTADEEREYVRGIVLAVLEGRLRADHRLLYLARWIARAEGWEVA